MQHYGHESRLWLSVAEALGILDLVLTAPRELTEEQERAVEKLSDYCRRCLRDSPSERSASPA